MNVDPYRERCQIEDLQPAKLRRVSFCVDVEIASAVKYPDEEGDDSPPPPPNKKPGPTELEKSAANRKTKEQKVKMKDKAEAEALKHPQGVVDQKDSDDNIKSTEEKMDETPDPVAAETTNNGVNGTNGTNGEVKELTRKKEKKKRSEEERKERKERKRQTAVANGTIPIEIAMESSSSGYSTPGPPTPSTRPHDRPTTDPVRIYRRCCQLRETPILKRVTDQLSAPCAIDSHEDGLVSCLDLSNFEMHLSDMVTLGDYLAVVPVKKLILENCGLTDESLRVVLAGLLAVKTPDQAKYNKDLARRPSDVPKEQTERLGVIEKVSIKNNPNIGRDGWRHIGLFIHMSRSLKAIDLSMVPFPGRLSSPPTFSINLKSQSASKTPADISVTFEKCLAERLAGSRLEEIVMGECSLETEHVEKIVHGVMSCGVTRLGLANNHLSNEALQAVAKYLEASTCEGLDLGGNDLSNNLDIITQAINNDANKLYALSLADCNLSTADLKPLLPALARLPNFRFIDLSHNRKLFSTQPNAISILRKHLPHMNQLKRIHLNDVAMESEHCIALAEILPEIPSLAHLR